MEVPRIEVGRLKNLCGMTLPTLNSSESLSNKRVEASNGHWARQVCLVSFRFVSSSIQKCRVDALLSVSKRHRCWRQRGVAKRFRRWLSDGQACRSRLGSLARRREVRSFVRSFRSIHAPTNRHRSAVSFSEQILIALQRPDDEHNALVQRIDALSVELTAASKRFAKLPPSSTPSVTKAEASSSTSETAPPLTLIDARQKVVALLRDLGIDDNERIEKLVPRS